MPLTTKKPLNLTILITALALLPWIPGSCAGSQKTCTPSQISGAEAEKVLGSIPAALAARQSGGTLTFVKWDPGGGFRSGQFYFFQLLSSSTSDTPLDNGMIGYFGVNKATGEVVELNSDKPHVEGTELQRVQKALRIRHCVTEALVRANADLSLEK